MSGYLTRDERIELSALGYVLIAITIGIAAGRIAVVLSNERDTAFLSANDRSRWCTVAALVEDGTFAIDRQVNIRDKSGRRHPWASIDRVRHSGPDGLMHDYSSKPPLFTTIVAAVYWAVQQATQMTLTDQPIYLTRIMLALVNLPMLLVFLIAVWRSILDCFAPDSAKLFGLSVACCGTALLPMTISLNNHLPAAMSTAVVMCVYLSTAGKTQLKFVATSYFVAGLAAAFAVANELPSLAMLAIWTLLFYRQHALATTVVFLPAVLLVTIAFFVTNLLAHQSLRPPYMHRGDGAIIGELKTNSESGVPTAAEVSQWLGNQPVSAVKATAGIELLSTSSSDRWIIQTPDGNVRYALVRSSEDSVTMELSADPKQWNVHYWDHWYDYPGSYWTAPRKGVDRGEASRLKYFFNLTVGYYGLFSLTPVWLLVPIGLALRLSDSEGRYRFYLAAGIAAVSLICIAFYVSRPMIDRNYGGVSSSFRWLLWLTPLWIWAMMPAVTEAMINKWLRPVALVLLATSLFSVATALDNPWQHPWLYRYLNFLGWLEV